MNKFKAFLRRNKKLLILSIIIWIYAFRIDAFVNLFNIRIIYVDSGFISNMFLAQFTIAVLSFTILTIITGSLSEICCGFSLKEILNFESGLFDFRGFVIIPFINILFTSIFYALNWINAIEAMFVYTVFLVCSFGVEINKYIFDRNYSYKSIEQEINRRIKRKNIEMILEAEKRLVDRLLEISKIKQNSREQKIITIILNTLMLGIQNDKEVGREIINSSQNIFKQLFSSFNSNYGYKEAIGFLDQILKNCNEQNLIYDKREIYLYPLEKVVFYNDIDLYNSQLTFVFEDIDNFGDIGEDLISFLAYQYFKNIYTSIGLSKQYRQSLISRFIDNITRFYSQDDNKFNKINEQLILHIVKNMAILERDQELFLIIISSVFEKNEYAENGTFSRVLSYITLILYSYAFRETEMLSSEFRKEIEGFNAKRKSTINTEAINLNYLVLRYNEKIIAALGSIILDEGQKFRFDYFPGSLKVKTTVWTEKFLVEFMFMFYLIFHENYWETSILSYISDWKTLSSKKKEEILYFTINCFDINTKDSNGTTAYNFKNGFQNELVQVSKWFNKDVSINNEYLRNLFENINNELVEIVKENVGTQAKGIIDINVLEANTILKEQLQEVYGFKSQILPSHESKRLYINPLVYKKEYTNSKTIADIVKHSLFKYLNDYIRKTLPSSKLSFDTKGVRTLLRAIKNHPVDIRNYTFTNDWAINRQTKETEEFSKLLEKENEIPLNNLSYLRYHAYLVSKDFGFSIEILEITNRSLKDEELDKYTENFKAANGLFNIDRCFVNKSEAMRLIKSSHEVINITIGFKTTITKRSGFVITFDYGTSSDDIDRNNKDSENGE